ncbi:hypothetical protein TraAM80_08782 [Trypanosoma rangeli]|uniref:Uncharacterized protein n=1 Tax=Trypanosoma rangeli TaxID=5698 RepID=A0A422MYZ8_TRYRA|nr:uncharacterized protein TraAM80_08782 [Trypanosoma rangeli]RNE98464.1 hypothetical protein TraAM80_08782 [Trypanosoma rangeli]|eukprot:RNE98464.1 hypothetical protein TraAM80_08782 [Trypanosoma rangeli]
MTFKVRLRAAQTLYPSSPLARQQLHPSQPMPHRLELNAGTPLLAEAFVRHWGHPGATSPRAGYSLRKDRRCTANCPDGPSACRRGKRRQGIPQRGKIVVFFLFLLRPRLKGHQQWQLNCGECGKQKCGKKPLGHSAVAGQFTSESVRCGVCGRR